jgi:hypothetical protein
VNHDGKVSGLIRVRDGARLSEQVDDDRSVLDALDAARNHLSNRKGVLSRGTSEQM